MQNLPLVSRILQRVMIVVLTILGSAMLLVVLAQVFFRYVLSHPLPWSEELARYLMVWTACLAASEAYAKGYHVGVTLLLNKLKPRYRKMMSLVIHLAVCVLMSVVVYQGITLCNLLEGQTSPAMGLPMMWPYTAVPAGGGLILIQALALLLKQASEPPEGEACLVEG